MTGKLFTCAFNVKVYLFSVFGAKNTILFLCARVRPKYDNMETAQSEFERDQ